MMERLQVRIHAGVAGEFSSLHKNLLCVLTLVRCPLHPLLTAVARKEKTVTLPKVQVAGYT